MIWVFLGGGLGAVIRYIVSFLINAKSSLWGTFWVNISGCFLFGLLASFINNDTLKYFLLIGFCGGYTTFSTFINESIGFINDNKADIIKGFIYVALSLIFGIIVTFVGLKISNFFS